MTMKWSAAAFSVVAALAVSDSYADVYQARFPPVSTADEINGSMGGSTARSFAGAARMSHKFFSGQPPVDEATIISACRSFTPSVNYWPESCNPDGMNTALRQWYSWVFMNYPSSQQTDALNLQLSALKNIGSPNIVPILGEADHWVSVWKMETNTAGAISKVHYLDGGPGASGMTDFNGNSYNDGFVSVSGFAWTNWYYMTLYSVGQSDPYFGRYLNMYEPPPDFVADRVFRTEQPPSPLRDRDVVTPHLVRERAMDSLRLATLDVNAEIWTAFQNSTPSLPFLVSGVWPNGSAWDYYLVPFRNEKAQVVGMAILDSEKLTFQMAWALSEPRAFGGFTKEQARQKAMGNLRQGEALGDGLLTWDPAGPASSPTFPYYEFSVHGRDGQVSNSVRVRLDTGELTARDVCQMSRRTRPTRCASN